MMRRLRKIGSRSSKRARGSQSARRKRLGFQALEMRRMLASDIGLSDGFITITGSDLDDAVDVYNDGDQVVVSTVEYGESGDVAGSLTESFDSGDVRGIYFQGNAGDDVFVNDTGLRAVVRGGSGDDTLVGGGARDVLHGSHGSDVLIGALDIMMGGAGDNALVTLNENTTEEPSAAAAVAETAVEDPVVVETADQPVAAEETAVEEVAPPETPPESSTPDESCDETATAETAAEQPAADPVAPEAAVPETDAGDDVADAAATSDPTDVPVDDGQDAGQESDEVVSDPAAENTIADPADTTPMGFTMVSSFTVMAEPPSDLQSGSLTGSVVTIMSPQRTSTGAIYGPQMAEATPIFGTCEAVPQPAPGDTPVPEDITPPEPSETLPETPAETPEAPTVPVLEAQPAQDSPADAGTEASPNADPPGPAAPDVPISNDDVLIGGPGRDLVFGGPGDDLLFGDDIDDALMIDLLAGFLNKEVPTSLAN